MIFQFVLNKCAPQSSLLSDFQNQVLVIPPAACAVCTCDKRLPDAVTDKKFCKICKRRCRYDVWSLWKAIFWILDTFTQWCLSCTAVHLRKRVWHNSKSSGGLKVLFFFYFLNLIVLSTGRFYVIKKLCHENFFYLKPKSRDAKTTRRNFTNMIRDDAKG